MAWTGLGFALYTFAIINMVGVFYSVITENYVTMSISFASYLLFVFTSAHIEKD